MEVAGMEGVNYENKLERWAGRMLLNFSGLLE
jgi:hypothetical protein